MYKRRLVSSALPYVNNLPHLGNLIQVLSADVYARFCRSRGYETLYVCGTDEYGTATETKALVEGITPQELCTQYYTVHKDIYEWFTIQFDKFGRTSTPEQTEIVQDIFMRLAKNGFILEKEIQQLYSEQSNMFLADRYVQGTCPKCSYESARGDQCEHCGTLLDPLELINPISIVDNTRPIVKTTKHLYIDLPKLLPKIEAWVAEAEKSNNWSKNAIKMTKAWMRDGLIERAITRDLKWGIPVPYEGFEHKVFYVWFDAPIGYISITATFTEDWKSWWRDPENVELIQFIGKDNIPFHTVVFPASLLGTGENWTMLHKMSSTEFLHYEDGMFSKSKGVGVFGNDVQDTGIPADAWRFYMLYNRPESSDYLFTWKDFQEAINGELINNFSNLYNRTLMFIGKYFDHMVESIDFSDIETQKIWQPVIEYEEQITAMLEKIELRQAYLKIFALSSYANKLLQDYEPWKLRSTDSDKAKWVLSNLVYIIKELAVLVEPYTPTIANTIADSLNIALPTWQDLQSITHQQRLDSIAKVNTPKHLFKRLENEEIARFKARFAGSQSDREAREVQDSTSLSIAEQFANKVCLKVCKIVEVSQHPDADKLYVLNLDDASEMGRTIVSGIKDYYTTEELTGKHIVVVANLKPAKLRGIKSNGMLLAASGVDTQNAEKEIVEVLFANDIPVGTIIAPKGFSSGAIGGAVDSTQQLSVQASIQAEQEAAAQARQYNTLKVEKFFEFAITTNPNKQVEVDGVPLMAVVDAKELVLQTLQLANAKVG